MIVWLWWLVGTLVSCDLHFVVLILVLSRHVVVVWWTLMLVV